MADKRTSENKAVTPSEDKARSVKPATSIRVRVVKAHDGIDVGTVMEKPTAVANVMIKKGYWEEI